jgi:hypothetical protein
MAILAMPEHGQDARGTFLGRPKGRPYLFGAGVSAGRSDLM